MHTAPLGRCMLIGAGIALILVTIFMSGANADPAWGPYWMIRPLIVVPLAGATGGLFYYLMDRLRCQGGWKKLAANVISFIIYLFGLWMGTVLGFNGTLWN
jgi:hypothetical protein